MQFKKTCIIYTLKHLLLIWWWPFFVDLEILLLTQPWPSPFQAFQLEGGSSLPRNITMSNCYHHQIIDVQVFITFFTHACFLYGVMIPMSSGATDCSVCTPWRYLTTWTTSAGLNQEGLFPSLRSSPYKKYKHFSIVP